MVGASNHQIYCAKYAAQTRERGRRKGGEQKQAVHIQPGVSPQPPPPQTLSQGRRKGDHRQAGEGRGRGGGGRFNASGKGKQIESKHTSRQLGRLGLVGVGYGGSTSTHGWSVGGCREIRQWEWGRMKQSCPGGRS